MRTDVETIPATGDAGHFFIVHRHVKRLQGDVVVKRKERPGHRHQKLSLAHQSHRVMHPIDAPQGKQNDEGGEKVVGHPLFHSEEHGPCADSHI